MSYNTPNNLFIPEDIQKQVDTIKEFYDSFKEKHSDIFEQDTEDNFIDFNWKSFPVPDGDRQKISFDVLYSDKLPIDIKNEFEDYLKKSLGK